MAAKVIYLGFADEEMERMRRELLTDPKVRIGAAVMRDYEAVRAERRALRKELREIDRDYPDGRPADMMSDRRRAIVNRLDELARSYNVSQATISRLPPPQVADG